jgi:hypothetical protein
MSSTRNAETYTSNWETPRWAVRRLIEAENLPAGWWLEPGAGNGRIIQAMEEDRPGAYNFIAVELRPECKPALSQITCIKQLYCGMDFLTWNARDAWSKIKERPVTEKGSYFTGAILNPAFPITLETLHKCLTICDEVHLLQRLNWLGGGENDGKNEFLQNFMPNVSVLPNRIQFMIDGEFPRYPEGAVDSKGRSIAGRKMPGDSIEYAWYSWGQKPLRFQEYGRIRTLGITSLEERLAG